MRSILAGVMAVAFVAAQPAFACFEIPRLLKLKGSSFDENNKITLGMKCNPRFYVTDSEKNTIAFERRDGKICVTIHEDGKAPDQRCEGSDKFKELGLDGGKQITIKNNGKNDTVLQIGNQGELLVFSVGGDGRKDLSKPYYKVILGNKDDIKIESLSGGNLVGEFNGKASKNTCYTRSITVDKEDPAAYDQSGNVNMAGFSHTSEGGHCSASYKATPMQPRPAGATGGTTATGSR